MKRSWIIRASLCGAMACLWASVLLAKPGIVKTRDGRTLEGDVAEKDDAVIVTLRGIPTSIARDNIDTVQYTGSIEDQYKQKLANLPKNASAKDHLEVARWLFEGKSYELARKEADAALQLDPNDTDANTLYTTIQSQMRMEHNRLPGTPVTPGTPPKTPAEVKPIVVPPPGQGVARTAAMHKYLSPEQINLVKQGEWLSDDASVKVTIGADVKKKYIARMQDSAAAFSGLSAQEQAKQILQDGSAEERKEIRIVNDPSPLAEYKKTIQPMILTGCATAGCHGGASGGKLFLYGLPDGDAATYTNFYLISQTNAQVGGAERMMIDRSYSDKSLIALFGLPSEISKANHPEVKGVTWRPIFRSKDDPQYKALVKWIDKLKKPDPNYGITFSIDGVDAKADEKAVPVPVTPEK